MIVKIQVLETVLAFTIVVLLGLLLRKFSVITQEDKKVFTKLLTKVVLPAAIFLQLSGMPVRSSQLLMVLSVFIAGIASMLLAWLAGKLLKLSKDKTGALMLTSSFGSSALIGYPFIAFSFPGNSEAMSDAVILSELGVGLPLFVLGPVIAIYFGNKSDNYSFGQLLSLSYFRSPIFISVILGIAVSFIPFNRESVLFAPFFEALKMINGALTVLASLILCLQLKIIPLKGLLFMFLISALIQMWFQPFIAQVQAHLYHLSDIQTQVLVLISAMPSAVLGPVFASQYDCAPETASALVMAHIISSVVMIPSVYYFLG
jgi:predicted permease